MLYTILMIALAVCLLAISLKITVSLALKNKNWPRASRFRKPVLLNVGKHVRLTSIIERCNVVSAKKGSVCPESTVCTHLKSDLTIYHDTGETFIVLPRNTSSSDGYCLRSVENFACNPFTGDPIVVSLNNSTRFVCKCKYPHLINKISLFGDCDNVIACRPGGQLLPTGPVTFDPLQDGRCDCIEKYVGVHDKDLGPYCKKRRLDSSVMKPCLNGELVTQKATGTVECQCPDGYMLVSKTGPPEVHADFRNNLPDYQICVKNPCMWNAYMPNEPFPTNRMRGDECQCDPFTSIPLETQQSILTGKQNACLSPSPQSLKQASDLRYGCCFFNRKDHRPECKFYYVYNPASRMNEKSSNIYEVLDNWDSNLFQELVEEHGLKVDSNLPNGPCDDPLLDYEQNVLRSLLLYNRPDVKAYNPLTVCNCNELYPVSCGKAASFTGSHYPLCKYKFEDPDLKDKLIIGPAFSKRTHYNCFWIKNIRQILANRHKGLPTPKPQIHFYDNFHTNRTFPPDF